MEASASVNTPPPVASSVSILLTMVIFVPSVETLFTVWIPLLLVVPVTLMRVPALIPVNKAVVASMVLSPAVVVTPSSSWRKIRYLLVSMKFLLMLMVSLVIENSARWASRVVATASKLPSLAA